MSENFIHLVKILNLIFSKTKTYYTFIRGEIEPIKFVREDICECGSDRLVFLHDFGCLKQEIAVCESDVYSDIATAMTQKRLVELEQKVAESEEENQENKKIVKNFEAFKKYLKSQIGNKLVDMTEDMCAFEEKPESLFKKLFS